jgi:hypothetical protein
MPSPPISLAARECPPNVYGLKRSANSGDVEIAVHRERAGTFEPQISRITDRVVEEMQAWATRPLDEVYAAVFIDAIVIKICDGQVDNRPIYARQGDPDRRDVVGNVWPLTTVQTCIVHLIRNTFQLASRKYSDELKRDLRPAYTVEAGAERVRCHLRRPIPGRRNLLINRQNTVGEILLRAGTVAAWSAGVNPFRLRVLLCGAGAGRVVC